MTTRWGGQQFYHSGDVSLSGVAAASRFRMNGLAASATESNHQLIIPQRCVVTGLLAKPVAAIAAGSEVNVILRKNGADTALTLNFLPADGSAAKTANGSRIAFAAGDLVSLRFQSVTGTAPTTTFRASFRLLFAGA